MFSSTARLTFIFLLFVTLRLALEKKNLCCVHCMRGIASRHCPHCIKCMHLQFITHNYLSCLYHFHKSLSWFNAYHISFLLRLHQMFPLIYLQILKPPLYFLLCLISQLTNPTFLCTSSFFTLFILVKLHTHDAALPGQITNHPYYFLLYAISITVFNL